MAVSIKELFDFPAVKMGKRRNNLQISTFVTLISIQDIDKIGKLC